MTTKKSTKQHFPYQCQTKANTIKRGKSIERNFYIDFTAKQAMEQSSDLSTRGKVINENVSNENRYLNSANKTMGDEMDIRYRNFRKDRLNYKNYILSTDSSLTSSLYSPSISTSASSRSSSVKSRAQIPSLPDSISKKSRSSKKINNKQIQNKYQKAPSRSNHKTRTKENLLSENYYDSDYDSTLDYLISDYDDYQSYDYDYDYDSFQEIPPKNNRKGRIHFINGNSNLYNISEISDLNTQSEIKSHKSHHRHQKQNKERVDSRKIKKHHQSKPNINQNIEKVSQNHTKSTFKPKFCATEDLTESFLDDLTDHPRHKDEEEECNETIKKLLDNITSEINRVQSNSSRRPLKISSPIHIFANNPTIQRIKGRIPPSDVYMHVPVFDNKNTSSISQMSCEDNDLTISNISFNNFGSPSPIKAKSSHSSKSSNQVKRVNIPNDDSSELNTNVNQANNEYIKKIKSRNVNYQQMLNNQDQSQNEKQKLMIKRTKNPPNSKEQNIQPVNDANINHNRLTIIPVSAKSQDNSNKRQPNDKNQRSQNFNPNQTKKMIQSLFANQENETTKQIPEEQNIPSQISKTPQTQSQNNNINTTTNDQNKKYPANPSVQIFIRQNDEIIEDLKQKGVENHESLEKINLIPHLTSSLITDNSIQKGDETKGNNPQNSELENLNNKTISSLSTINKVSNLTSGSDQSGDKTSNTNDLLSDSYDDLVSADAKTTQNKNNKTNNNDHQNQNTSNQEILFDEETYNNMTTSDLIDPSNAQDEIILSEIRGLFDESSSRGESHKIPMEKDNTNKEADQNSLSSLNNDDFLED